MRFLRKFLLLSGLGAGCISLYKILLNTLLFLSGGLDNWTRDFYQYFLAAKALRDGISPYMPLDLLADRYISQVYVSTKIPYPPPFLLAVAPLGYLELRPAAAVWFVLQVVCLVLAVYFLLSTLSSHFSFSKAGIVLILLLGWHPFLEDLFFGNVMIIFLLFFLLVWRFLRNGQDVLAGGVLGVILAFKLLGWLILPYLLFKRRWKALIPAVMIPIFANLLSLFFLSPAEVWSYYTKVGSEGVNFYQASSINYSLWSLAWRFFSGTGAGTAGWIFASPVVDAPALAPLFSTGLVLLVVLLGLFWAFQAKSFDQAFAVLLTATVLVNPVAWAYYFTLLLLPLALLLTQLSARGWPNSQTLGLIVVVLLLLIPPYLFATLAVSLQIGHLQIVVNSGRFTISPLLALLTLFPLGGALGIFIFQGAFIHDPA